MNFFCDDKQTNKQKNSEDSLNVVNYIQLVPSGKNVFCGVHFYIDFFWKNWSGINAHYLTVSLRGPLLFLRRGRSPRCADGLDGRSIIGFFNGTLRSHILIYIYNWYPENFFVGFKIWSSWGVQMQTFKNTI